MPVYRFRDFEDARRALWTDRDDPQLLLRLQRMWKFSALLFPGGVPRGVRKFRDIAEANRDREAWVKQRVLALRAARHGGGDGGPRGEESRTGVKRAGAAHPRRNLTA